MLDVCGSSSGTGRALGKSSLDDGEDGADRAFDLRLGQLAQRAVEQQAGQAVDPGPGRVLRADAALMRQSADLDKLVESRAEHVVGIGYRLGVGALRVCRFGG